MWKIKFKQWEPCEKCGKWCWGHCNKLKIK